MLVGFVCNNMFYVFWMQLLLLETIKWCFIYKPGKVSLPLILKPSGLFYEFNLDSNKALRPRNCSLMKLGNRILIKSMWNRMSWHIFCTSGLPLNGEYGYWLITLHHTLDCHVTFTPFFSWPWTTIPNSLIWS